MESFSLHKHIRYFYVVSEYCIENYFFLHFFRIFFNADNIARCFEIVRTIAKITAAFSEIHAACVKSTRML